jgi:hypothetical protein
MRSSASLRFEDKHYSKDDVYAYRSTWRLTFPIILKMSSCSIYVFESDVSST